MTPRCSTSDSTPRVEAAAWASRSSARLPTTCSAPGRRSTALRDRPARTTSRCARPSCAAGWLKEAHYREGWPVDGGAPVASVAYSIIRRDWQTGQTTTFIWEDLTD